MFLAGAGFFVAHGENLVPNGNFEDGFNRGWYGGVFGDGPGKVITSDQKTYEGKFSAYLLKERGPKGSGSQLFSPMIPIGQSRELIISMKYRGSGNFIFSFWNKTGDQWNPVKSALGEPANKWVELKKKDDWTDFSVTFPIPESYLQAENAVRFQFQVWGSGNVSQELYLDDISITGGNASKETPVNPSIAKKLTIVLPQPLNAREAADYGPPPVLLRDFELKNGLIYRSGKPYFWVGDGGTLGASQSNVASMWLARVLGNRFSSVDGGGAPYPLKKDERELVIGFSNFDGASLYSMMRELLRYQIISELPLAAGSYQWSSLREVSKEYPALGEIFFPGNHFYSADHNTVKGRMLNEGPRSTVFRYIRDMPMFGLEAYRELGYTPSHERVRMDFREYAKNKYGTLTEANLIWHKNYSSWDKVQPPHLDSDDLWDESMQIQFRGKASRDYPEMYYDWLRFVQLDLVVGLKAEKEDFRKWSNAPFMLDLRAHTHYSDCYVASDPDLIDPIVDMFFLHRGFESFEHNNNPTDGDTLNRETLDTLFAYNFFKTNSKKALWNSECIVSTVGIPGSNFEVMKRNDYGKFHGQWKFKFDETKEGFTKNWQSPTLDDSNWSAMTVPGCWDETEEFRGKSGWAWYRKSFRPTGAVKQDYLDGSRKFYLYGCGIAQRGTIWLNGHKVGDVVGWQTPYQFDVGRYLNFDGENQITIFVDGTGFSNGLRFYVHLLADNMINESKPFGEKQYVSLLWSYMMHGSSAVSLWNWNTVFRPYMPKLINEINSVSEFVLPDVRKNKSCVAFLYPYLYAKGLPFISSKDYNDPMHYYNAFEFKQIRPDIFSEENFRDVMPQQYKLAVFPYAKIVQPETWEHFQEYVRNGGTAIVTYDSMQKTFERYQKTNLEVIAGIKIIGENKAESIIINGKKFQIETGDFTGSKGVKIASAGAKVCSVYPDGSPAVTENIFGKGKIIFIAPRLDIFAVQEVLKNEMPVPEIKITSADQQEYPFIEAVIAGENESRKILYLHNWGGLNHELTVSLPQKYGNYRARSIRENFTRLGADTFSVNIPASAPAVLLLEAEQEDALDLKGVPKELQAVLDRLVELDKDGDGKRPAVLFLADLSRSNIPVGRQLYPMLTDALCQLGYETKTLDWQQWTPETLAQYKMVFLAEDWSPCYEPLLKGNSPFLRNVLDYVKNGGSLFLMSYSGLTTNAQAKLLNAFGNELGASLAWGGIAYDPGSCGFGDPLQIRSHNISTHVLGDGIRSVQFYVNRPMTLKRDSILQAVVLTNNSDERQPDKAVIAAGEFGKGRVVLCSDLLWLQPFRIECDDNARLLMNTLGWLLRNKVTEQKKLEFKSNLFITTEKMEKIEGLL